MAAKPEANDLSADARQRAETAKRRLKMRNLAIAGGLIFLIILFYLITIFKLGGSVLNRSL